MHFPAVPQMTGCWHLGESLHHSHVVTHNRCDITKIKAWQRQMDRKDKNRCRFNLKSQDLLLSSTCLNCMSTVCSYNIFKLPYFIYSLCNYLLWWFSFFFLPPFYAATKWLVDCKYNDSKAEFNYVTLLNLHWKWGNLDFVFYIYKSFLIQTKFWVMTDNEFWSETDERWWNFGEFVLLLHAGLITNIFPVTLP